VFLFQLLLLNTTWSIKIWLLHQHIYPIQMFPLLPWVWIQPWVQCLPQLIIPLLILCIKPQIQILWCFLLQCFNKIPWIMPILLLFSQILFLLLPYLITIQMLMAFQWPWLLLQYSHLIVIQLQLFQLLIPIILLHWVLIP